MKKGIFITGTDTGVGKTFLAAALLRVMREKGLTVCPMKPVETGCISRRGKLIPADAMELIEAAGVNEELDRINPYRLKNPLAPAIAAEIEGVRIHRRKILSAYRRLSRKYELVIVEGAGGIMVPVYKKYLFLDLIRDLNIPVIVVARPGLGTVNHTVVINASMKTRKGLPEKTNPGLIEQLGEVPVLGNAQYLDENDSVLDGEFRTIADKILRYV
ncbi:MAG: hypothetical protein AMK70_16050 [Nitrospira bacterium SG8_35_1]|nr:MAG: hypothetical protein AMK70_16050 [Nitrospira bacterium SG8_35_1]